PHRVPPPGPGARAPRFATGGARRAIRGAAPRTGPGTGCAWDPAMDWLSVLLIVAGLCLFETISSVDNAIINAEVLPRVSARARRWFLLWGILIAVVLVRGLLPWLIVWMTIPSLGPVGALTATFSSDPAVARAIQEAAPVLLAGAGTFLVFLFF